MKPRRAIVVKPQSEVQSAINVTPLVDVVLVLLIIFMVVMPLLDKDLQVRIPEDEQVERPDELPPEQIIVHVLADGSLQLNGTPISEDSYVATLQSHLSARALEQRVVFVAADGAAQYKRLIDAFEGARRAGADTLAMMPEDLPPSAAEPTALSGYAPDRDPEASSNNPPPNPAAAPDPNKQ
jgi:biopolymer transport protein ExbD/biopolymer transport protein TolR